MDYLSVIAFKYSIFAVISTLLNLFSQYLSFSLYQGGGSILIAMFFGTGAGLLSKYILDKKFIFNYIANNKKHESKTFLLYSFTGVFTTAIFCGMELLFDYLIDHDTAKYAGAVVGLSMGYIIKYFLDKSFVFKSNEVKVGPNAI